MISKVVNDSSGPDVYGGRNNACLVFFRLNDFLKFSVRHRSDGETGVGISVRVPGVSFFCKLRFSEETPRVWR